jgi:hypothetical protein
LKRWDNDLELKMNFLERGIVTPMVTTPQNFLLLGFDGALGKAV